MEASSNGYFSLKEGSLYPILYRLEDKKYIESYKKSFEGERRVPRKYYKITELGIENLVEMKKAWIEFSSQVENIL